MTYHIQNEHSSFALASLSSLVLPILSHWCSQNDAIARTTPYPLLEIRELLGGEGVSLANDWDNVDSGAQTLHQLDINLSQAKWQNSNLRKYKHEERGGKKVD